MPVAQPFARAQMSIREPKSKRNGRNIVQRMKEIRSLFQPSGHLLASLEGHSGTFPIPNSRPWSWPSHHYQKSWIVEHFFLEERGRKIESGNTTPTLEIPLSPLRMHSSCGGPCCYGSIGHYLSGNCSISSKYDGRKMKHGTVLIFPYRKSGGWDGTDQQRIETSKAE